MSGIYLITNLVNSNLYVGKTKNTLKARFAGHVYDAKHGSMTNLAKAIRKYGAESFSIELLKECHQDELNELEKFFIDKLQPSYNMTPGGEGGDTGMSKSRWVNNGVIARRIRVDEAIPDGFVLGILESTKAKMRKKRAPFSEEACENMRQARLKFRHTEESKAKMSQVRLQMNFKHTDETRAKMSASHKKRHP